MRLPGLPAVAAATLVFMPATAVPGLARGTANAQDDARNASPRIELEACGPDGREREMLCGTIMVPEDPGEPRRSIPLRVLVVRALDGDAGPSALVPLEGGPGLAITEAASFYLSEEGRDFRRGRDVVLVDQRGTGGSGPLRCPGKRSAGRHVPARRG